MRQHQENTLEIAQWLEQQPFVRLSVGFEQVSDLLRDLERAL
jgi:cystathionine beta-lyase/cystathionine gamma-synthase